uniref:Uncharacterized protein n=1 Tax=Candidatus Kentrum sp. TUN TaxID=2126343 RepID=A0A450ZDE5_9GAMM|nr:MAG: hypothetical protein BECKTUN1418D_GA0071000_101118 [Candidatus Kentron sp. TUN]VFK53960.1 MAG: hypothetical protein BECKTUN1418F_GA0071002_103417 [Candidatus Kentron sp. TUN]VFK55976.1 MAG: hypothetical protein BECKTUN1418E_GA0071001_103516 [Candidatus Kentron sp. TUN]
MKRHPLFSVRKNLLAPGKPNDIFQRCLVSAKHFIDTNTVSDILDYAFKRDRNRKLIIKSVYDFLHVGFISPYRDLTPHDMKGLSDSAGFLSSCSTVNSAVVARELGCIEGKDDIPTAIFTADVEKEHGRSAYVEVFIPNEEKTLVRKWVENEIGTHIGFILSELSNFEKIQDAFLEEEFQIASFMGEKKIDNPDKRVSVIYYEKYYEEGKLRMEVLSPWEK